MTHWPSTNQEDPVKRRGITQIPVITTPHELDNFRHLLNAAFQHGLKLFPKNARLSFLKGPVFV